MKMKTSTFAWLLLVLAQAGLSPTRLIARFLIWSKVIDGFRMLLLWNLIFYIAIFGCYSNFALNGIFVSHPVIIGLFALMRVDELVFAFYGDAIAKKKKDKKGRLPIQASSRMVLLSLAYLEVLSLFGLIYYSVHLAVSCAFKDDFTSPFEALYLSAMTLTTTGYGDFVPKSTLSRLATMYEAVTGVIFIALALAAYIGDKEDEFIKPIEVA